MSDDGAGNDDDGRHKIIFICSGSSIGWTLFS